MSSARASTSWMTGGSTASRQCSRLGDGDIPAETPASGYRRRRRRFRVWTASCRSKARRTTRHRGGFSPEIARVSFDRPGTDFSISMALDMKIRLCFHLSLKVDDA
ncbi:hypothetical protein OsI_23429 [Oryza sativa Indica Group]|uniref:Uncharacterized protein n=1 Tax=Oryza sativa subsp. indica TaxID=39946 RepID=B8B3U0_ORYSI|nr:hypothetical protein OsI_23429 [Oryza sativa Indica Group]